jgi:hypothetical protein
MSPEFLNMFPVSSRGFSGRNCSESDWAIGTQYRNFDKKILTTTPLKPAPINIKWFSVRNFFAETFHIMLTLLYILDPDLLIRAFTEFHNTLYYILVLFLLCIRSRFRFSTLQFKWQIFLLISLDFPLSIKMRNCALFHNICTLNFN